MMNTNLLSFVTPPSIYHQCSTRKTIWEENFKCEEKLFSAVKMKNCGQRNVRKHRLNKDSDKYVNLDISLKYESLDKMKITFSYSKKNWKDQESG